MSKYYCESCNYYTKFKSSLDKHYKTKKHLESTKSQQKVNIESTKSQHKMQLLGATHDCKYCMKKFKSKQSMYRHIKYSCKQNKDEDLKELVRLLNEQNNQMKEQNMNLSNQVEKMQKQIDKLSSKLQIQNINNTNNNSNNTINYNIKLLNYNQTDYSHLTEEDYVNCIKDVNYCVKSLIQKVHFNEEKPENKNIYISNIKNKYVMLYKNNKWQIVNRKNQLDDLYDYNEVLLENWYSEYKDKYPDMIKSFERYLNNKQEEDGEIINKAKDEILLLLYNNRLIGNEVSEQEL